MGIKKYDTNIICEMYKNGLSMNSIAKKIGTTHCIIAYHLYKNKIHIRNRKEIENLRVKTDELKELYLKGWSTVQLSEKFGLKPQSIYSRLYKNKVKIRGVKESVILAYKNGRSRGRRGKENSLWKGGVYKTKSGYIELYVSPGKRIKEHIKVWEDNNGKISKGYIVHHLNGIRSDNRIENLIAIPRKRHSPILIVEPHKKRIIELEKQVYDLRKELKI